MIRVCFVCLGNICRSPTAAGIMVHLVREAGLDGHIEVRSAGTADYHVGELADRRSRQEAERRGVVLADRAQYFEDHFFEHFDYILPVDRPNYHTLLARAPSDAARAKVRLLRSFDPEADEHAEVPDPYYGGPKGFAEVFDMCDAACRGLLAHIRRSR
jgi:protein-tyrosine phosphatase